MELAEAHEALDIQQEAEAWQLEQSKRKEK